MCFSSIPAFLISCSWGELKSVCGGLRLAYIRQQIHRIDSSILLLCFFNLNPTLQYYWTKHPNKNNYSYDTSVQPWLNCRVMGLQWQLLTNLLFGINWAVHIMNQVKSYFIIIVRACISTLYNAKTLSFNHDKPESGSYFRIIFTERTKLW